MAGTARPTAPVRSLSDTIPVDVYELGGVGGGGGSAGRPGPPETQEAIQGRVSEGWQVSRCKADELALQVSMYVRIVNGE